MVPAVTTNRDPPGPAPPRGIVVFRSTGSTGLAWVRRVADALFIPFSVGGGVRTWEGALRLLDAGADRVSIGSAAVRAPEVLTAIAERAGRQAVILSVDARHVTADRCVATRRGGREDTTVDAMDLARAGAALGAGIFHDGSCRVGDVKRYLQAHGVEVRPC